MQAQHQQAVQSSHAVFVGVFSAECENSTIPPKVIGEPHSAESDVSRQESRKHVIYIHFRPSVD